MKQSDNEMDALRESPASVVQSNAFRQVLLQQTTAVVRRRRRVRQLGVVAGLFVVYAAGMMTEHLRLSTHQQQIAADSRQQAPTINHPPAPSTEPEMPLASKNEVNPQTSHTSDDEIQAKENDNASAAVQADTGTETVNAASTEQKARKVIVVITEPHQTRYKTLARRSDELLYQQNIPAAIDLYNKSLRVATEEELKVASDDTWLMMALKVDRQKREDAAKQPANTGTQPEPRSNVDWRKNEDV